MTDKLPPPLCDGGPAFPTERFTSYGNGAGVTTREGGMSLRDWFAGQVLNGLISKYGTEAHMHVYAEKSYQMADAMIAARDGDREAQEHG